MVIINLKKIDVKTNVILNRPMGQFSIKQRTRDGFFDANALLLQWNSVEGNTRRRVDKFLESSNTREFIDELKRDLSNQEPLVKNDQPDFQVVKTIKGRNTKNGRTKNQVWMHPYLFVKFAMWVNPRFEVKVIRFVYDQLVQLRKDSSDSYLRLAESIKTRYGKYDIARRISYVSTAINYIVFNEHYKGIRNDSTEEQQRELSKLEEKLCSLISEGFIPKYKDLELYLKNLWTRKYRPSLFQA